MRQGSILDAVGESNLTRRRRVIENAGRSRQGVIRFGVVDDLGVVNSKSAAEDHAAVASWIPHETDPGPEVFVGVGEGLLLVAQAQIHRQVLANANVILYKKCPERIVHHVIGVAVALGIVGNVVDVIKVGRGFTDRGGLAAVVSKSAKVDGAAKLFAVAPRARMNDLPTEAYAVPSQGGRNRVVQFVLMIQ